jgi:hypothetical protein
VSEDGEAAEADSRPEQANYLVRHWRGEHSLVVSYWLNGRLAQLLVFASNVPRAVPATSAAAAIGR